MQRTRGRGDGGHTEIALSAVKGPGSEIFLPRHPQPPGHPILLESSESLHTDILNFQSTQARQNRPFPSIVSWTNDSRSWKALCPALWRGSFCSLPHNWKYGQIRSSAVRLVGQMMLGISGLWALSMWNGSWLTETDELWAPRLNSSCVFPVRRGSSSSWEPWTHEKAKPLLKPGSPGLMGALSLRLAFSVGVPCPAQSGKIKPHTSRLRH